MMARPHQTPENQVPSPETEGAGKNPRARPLEEIVTGVAEPVDPGRYAGFDWVASLLGFAVAMFFLAVFLGIAAAVAASLGYRSILGSLAAAVSGPNREAVAAAGLAATILAYLIGGYAAGRVARFDGGRNGLGVVLWTVIVAVALSIGAAVLELRFGVAENLHLTLHLGVRVRSAVIAGAVAAAPVLVVMILGGLLGGALGSRYHRRVDQAVGVPAA